MLLGQTAGQRPPADRKCTGDSVKRQYRLPQTTAPVKTAKAPTARMAPIVRRCFISLFLACL